MMNILTDGEIPLDISLDSISNINEYGIVYSQERVATSPEVDVIDFEGNSLMDLTSLGDSAEKIVGYRALGGAYISCYAFNESGYGQFQVYDIEKKEFIIGDGQLMVGSIETRVDEYVYVISSDIGPGLHKNSLETGEVVQTVTLTNNPDINRVQYNDLQEKFVLSTYSASESGQMYVLSMICIFQLMMV